MVDTRTLQRRTTVQITMLAPADLLVGRRLRFIGYTDDVAGPFKRGDLLLVLTRNKCGMGIDVLRPDGIADMVWPEEVD
jgi:hypothetical protein